MCGSSYINFFLNGKVQYYTIFFLNLVTGREISVLIEKSFQWQKKYVMYVFFSVVGSSGITTKTKYGWCTVMLYDAIDPLPIQESTGFIWHHSTIIFHLCHQNFSIVTSLVVIPLDPTTEKKHTWYTAYK
jgi:hypothetical protein